MKELRIKAYDKLSELNRKIYELASYEQISDLFDQMKLLFSNICGIVQKSKKSHNEKLMEHIEQYIQQNFDKADISLTAIGK